MRNAIGAFGNQLDHYVVFAKRIPNSNMLREVVKGTEVAGLLQNIAKRNLSSDAKPIGRNTGAGLHKATFFARKASKPCEVQGGDVSLVMRSEPVRSKRIDESLEEPRGRFTPKVAAAPVCRG